MPWLTSSGKSVTGLEDIDDFTVVATMVRSDDGRAS